MTHPMFGIPRHPPMPGRVTLTGWPEAGEMDAVIVLEGSTNLPAGVYVPVTYGSPEGVVTRMGQITAVLSGEIYVALKNKPLTDRQLAEDMYIREIYGVEAL